MRCAVGHHRSSTTSRKIGEIHLRRWGPPIPDLSFVTLIHNHTQDIRDRQRANQHRAAAIAQQTSAVPVLSKTATAPTAFKDIEHIVNSVNRNFAKLEKRVMRNERTISNLATRVDSNEHNVELLTNHGFEC